MLLSHAVVDQLIERDNLPRCSPGLGAPGLNIPLQGYDFLVHFGDSRLKFPLLPLQSRVDFPALLLLLRPIPGDLPLFKLFDFERIVGVFVSQRFREFFALQAFECGTVCLEENLSGLIA